MANMIKKRAARKARKIRVRLKVRGTTERPRLAVFRSAKHIYVQVIDDTKGATLVSASTVADKVDGKGKARAAAVGKLIAERAKEKGVEAVVFDRAGYRYHGQVKELADGAREAGLKV